LLESEWVKHLIALLSTNQLKSPSFAGDFPNPVNGKLDRGRRQVSDIIFRSGYRTGSRQYPEQHY